MENLENKHTSWRDCIVISIIFIIVMFLHNASTTESINEAVEVQRETNSILINIKKEVVEKNKIQKEANIILNNIHVTLDSINTTMQNWELVEEETEK